MWRKVQLSLVLVMLFLILQANLGGASPQVFFFVFCPIVGMAAGSLLWFFPLTRLRGLGMGFTLAASAVGGLLGSWVVIGARHMDQVVTNCATCGVIAGLLIGLPLLAVQLTSERNASGPNKG